MGDTLGPLNMGGDGEVGWKLKGRTVGPLGPPFGLGVDWIPRKESALFRALFCGGGLVGLGR